MLTDCSSNERLPYGQDPRYVFTDFVPGPSNLTVNYVIDYSESVDQTGGGPPHSSTPFERQDPDNYETCRRGCFCGYSQLLSPLPTIAEPYDACDCFTLLSLEFLYSGDSPIPITSDNMTLLQFYRVIPCDATAGPGSTGNFTYTLSNGGIPYQDSWEWVKDSQGLDDVIRGTVYPLASPFECFGDFYSMGHVMRNYSQQQPYRADYDFANGTCSDFNTVTPTNLNYYGTNRVREIDS